MSKHYWFIYTFENNTTFAITRVKIIDNDNMGNIVIMPVDENGCFMKIPFDSMIVDHTSIFNTKREALISLRNTLKIALYNIDEFLENRFIGDGGSSLHIPDKIIK